MKSTFAIVALLVATSAIKIRDDAERDDKENKNINCTTLLRELHHHLVVLPTR